MAVSTAAALTLGGVAVLMLRCRLFLGPVVAHGDRLGRRQGVDRQTLYGQSVSFQRQAKRGQRLFEQCLGTLGGWMELRRHDTAGYSHLDP